jgi:hypothetical protein
MYETGSGRVVARDTKSLFYSQLGKSPKREENTNHGVSPPVV